MDFIREIVAFEQWLRTNHLPPLPQLLWHKLFMLCNGAGWPEWLVAENADLMALLKTRNEKSFIGYRDKLLEAGLIEFKRGKKGSPNRYKMVSLANCTYKSQAQSTVQTPITDCTYKLSAETPVQVTVQTPVQTTVYPTASYKQDKTRLDEDKENSIFLSDADKTANVENPVENPEAAKIWGMVLDILKTGHSATTIATWFSECRAVGWDGNRLDLRTDSELRDRTIAKEFGAKIKAITDGLKEQGAIT